MKRFSTLFVTSVLLSMFLHLNGAANENSETAFQNANTAYANAEYSKAITLYESILKNGQEASQLYFNLGNAYFKNDNIPYAILNYERAKRLSPSDESIIANLQLANSKIEDDVSALSTFFIQEWTNSIISVMTEKQWSITFILLLIVSLVLFALYKVTTNLSLKKNYFYGAVILMIISVFTFLIAKQSYSQMKNVQFAIITSSVVTVTGEPNEESTELFLLHQGTKVKVNKTEGDWLEIALANGNVGWIMQRELEEI